MGEITVKIHGKVEETFTTIEEAIRRLEEVKEIEEQNLALDFILENAGKLPEDFKVSEEELHIQGD